MQTKETNSNEDKPQSVGGLWIKENQYGKYFSMSIEVNGEKLNFVGYSNKYKAEGDNKPDYRIFASTKKAPSASSL